MRQNWNLFVLVRRKELGGAFDLDHAQLIPIPDVTMSFGFGVFSRAKVALTLGEESFLRLNHGKIKARKDVVILLRQCGRAMNLEG